MAARSTSSWSSETEAVLTPPVDPARYGAFLGVMAAMAIAPGPANLFAIATGAHRGKAAALAAVLGMNSATLVWFLGSALGLSVVMATFPALFRVLGFAGAIYLLWLGLKALWAARRAPAPLADAAHEVRPAGSAYWNGFLVQIANPKVLLFFTAVVPPFTDLARPIAPQMAAFAVATLAMDGGAMSAYGVGGAALAERMTRPRFRRGFSIFVGLLLLTAGGMILWREL